MSKKMQPHRENWLRELAFFNPVKREPEEAAEEKKVEVCYENVYFDLEEEFVNRTGKTRKRIMKREYGENEKHEEEEYEKVYFDLDEEFVNRTGKSIRIGHEDHMPQSPQAYDNEIGWRGRVLPPPNNPSYDNKMESGGRVPPPPDNPPYVNEMESEGRVPPPPNNPPYDNQTESDSEGWVPAPPNNPTYDNETESDSDSEGWVPPPPNNPTYDNETEPEGVPPPDYPYFVTRMRSNRRGALYIPNEVIKYYNLHLPNKAIIRDTRGHEWKTELSKWSDGRMWYTGGLANFRRVNYVKDDDYYICKIVEDEVKGLVLLIHKID